MNTSKGWYDTVLQINNELESRTKSDHSHPLDLLLKEQTNTLIQLFNQCEFVGFPKADPEAETIVSNILVDVQNSLSDKMDIVPDSPFFNLYLGLCYLEKVLQIIKQEYESNLNTNLEHLENIIYRSNDYQNLVEVSRNIGRKIINKQQHPDFGILKKHIAEQLEYIEQTKKIEKTLPPQPIDKQKPELRIDQIALKYAYEGLQITRENGNEIAKEYGHNSGEKLFQRFTYFSSSANRKGKPNLCTPKKLDNKIKLIESIIELLPTDKQERAKDEVLILKKIYEAEYQ